MVFTEVKLQMHLFQRIKEIKITMKNDLRRLNKAEHSQFLMLY